MILILPIAVSLGLDAFSVAMGASVFPTEDEGRRAFRLVFHFGLFQGGMALLGWLVGRSIEPIIADYDHWVAFLLLAYVGGRMLRAGWRGDIESSRADPSRGVMLVMMSVGTSIDALAIGMSLALSGSEILYPSLIIGLVAAVMTYIGLRIGHGLGLRFGHRVQIVGGLVLIFIGVRVVLSHLAA
jgi:putative Mn2+ efflux pump MntP